MALPVGFSERAVYVVSENIYLYGEQVASGNLVVLSKDARSIRANHTASVLRFEDEAVGERRMYWNCGASSKVPLRRGFEDCNAGRMVLLQADHGSPILPPDGPMPEAPALS